MASSSRNSANRRAARKAIGIGMVAGMAVGAVMSARARRDAESEEAPRHFIDWRQAQSIAVNLNRGEALTAVERERLTGEYRQLVEQCLPIVSGYMEVEIPSPVERTFAYDRVDWINANISSFQNLLAPIEEIGLSASGSSTSIASYLLGGFNRTVVSAEMGLMLGYLAKKVLGQYDLALLGGEAAEPGRLYYVEPNIRMVETMLRLPASEFRLWLALHETTHVFEFEGFPWVRPYFHSLLLEYFEFLKQDAKVLQNGVQGLRTIVDRVRTNAGEQRSWLEALMTPEQRVIFDKIQAVMSVIEGYSNHVMNAIGRDLLKDFDVIAKRFEQRQRQRGYAEQLFARITGLNLKMEQYRLGEQFVNAVVERHGKSAALQMWSGPESLPTMAEIRDPEAWMRRVLDPEGQMVAATLDVNRPTAAG